MPLRPATLAVKAGRSADAGAGVNPPISMSSTFRDGEPGRSYGRSDNPTWEAFEAAFPALEGGEAVAFASGMAAVAAVMDLVPVGGTVAVSADSYNGTRGWCADAAARGRLALRLVDVRDTAAVVDACQGADLLWLESPTNPRLHVADIRAIAAAVDTMVVVDNTVATPLLQRPLALGADAVVHSVSKWIGGHSDLIMGVVVTASDDILGRVRERRWMSGGIPGSFEAWLALRGLRTLPARLDRAQASVGELARRLDAHPAVSVVHYPGLPSDPGYALARAQMDGPGGILSFVLAGAAEADAVCRAVEVITPATSLGGVESLIERRARYAFEDDTPEGLLRLSVGQEDVEDLWDDLARALAQLG